MAKVTSDVSRNQLKQLMRFAIKNNITIGQAAARMIAAGLQSNRRRHVNKYERFKKRL